MGLLTIFGVAIGLAMDAFAVAVATGLAIRQLDGRHVFRLAFHFGLFQAMMPVLGWLAASLVSSGLNVYDHWIAFGLLAAIGTKMLYEAWFGKDGEEKGDPTRGMLLVTLSIATSIDAFAVGLSMGLLRLSIWLPSICIGLVAGGLTAVGIRFGNRIGLRFGHIAETVGGLVLIAIGVRIVLSHGAGV